MSDLTDEQYKQALECFAHTLSLGHRCSAPNCLACETLRTIQRYLTDFPVPKRERSGMGIYVGGA